MTANCKSPLSQTVCIVNSNEMQWLDFETRMRKIIKELVAPVVDRVQEDREAMLLFKREAGRHEERLVALETIVFRDQEVSTLIDDLKLRIEEGEATVRKEVAALADLSTNRFAESKEQVFAVDKRITANEVLKDQFEVFKRRQDDFENQWVGYKSEVRDQFSSMKEQFARDFKELSSELHTMKMDFNFQIPRIDDVQGQIDQLRMQLIKEDARFEGLQKAVIALEADKLDTAIYRRDNHEIIDTVHGCQRRMDDTVDQQKALQNWVEKYEPLKI